jgi:hypothetical protein
MRTKCRTLPVTSVASRSSTIAAIRRSGSTRRCPVRSSSARSLTVAAGGVLVERQDRPGGRDQVLHAFSELRAAAFLHAVDQLAERDRGCALTVGRCVRVDG